MQRTRPSRSRNSPPFTSAPSRLARFKPQTIVIGVDSTSAQGQAMTSMTSERKNQGRKSVAKLSPAEPGTPACCNHIQAGGSTAVRTASSTMAGV